MTEPVPATIFSSNVTIKIGSLLTSVLLSGGFKLIILGPFNGSSSVVKMLDAVPTKLLEVSSIALMIPT